MKNQEKKKNGQRAGYQGCYGPNQFWAGDRNISILAVAAAETLLDTLLVPSSHVIRASTIVR
jgi:hypothetical protein